MEFLLNGILVRGAISIGDFYIDDLMVWGDAIVKTYILESKNAIYPRIILDKNVKESAFVDEYIIDSDGIAFIDTLGILSSWIFPDFESDLEEILKSIQDSENIIVQKKIDWFKKYITSYKSYAGLFKEELPKGEKNKK